MRTTSATATSSQRCAGVWTPLALALAAIVLALVLTSACPDDRLLLSLQNILLAKDNVYKLADFGVAHMLDEENKTLLRSTEGTYHFLAPECTTGAEYDPFQVDIWALGVTLYAMLQGTLPFGTKAAGLTQVMDSIRDDPLEIGASVEPDCVAIMQLMLEKDPNKRIRIQDLKVHPWVLNGTDRTRLSRSGSAVAIEVSQQEIEAAFTPVNNFILMTKLKMKMSSRLARARKSVELRHDLDSASASRTPSVVERVSLDPSTDVATAALSLLSDICTPRPQMSELASALPASAQGALARRRSNLSKSNLDELDELVRATLPDTSASASSESVSHEAVAPLPHVHSALHAGSDAQCDSAAELNKALTMLTNAPAALSPSNRLSRRLSSSPPSGTLEPRLPPLDLSFSATPSPSQSPAVSPAHKERSREALGTSLQHHYSTARAAPERRHSNLDDAAASVHPVPSSLALASEHATESTSSSPSKSQAAVEESSRSPNGRRAVLQHARSIDSKAQAVRAGKESSTALPLSEPPVMLQHHKSGLPSPTSGIDTYAQALAEAKRKSSLMQRTNWGDKSAGAATSDAVQIDDRTLLKPLTKRHDERDTNASSSASTSSSPIGGAIPFLSTPRSPSRSGVRTESLVLSTSSFEESPGAPARASFPAPMARTSSIAKALTECLEPNTHASAAKSPGRGDSSDTSSISSASSRLRVGDKSPKVFEKRNSSSSPKRHDIPSPTGAPVPPANAAAAASLGKPELAHHWSGPSFGNIEDEIGVDAGSHDKPRRTSFVRVFSQRRSLLEAQDSLQSIMRRKSSARLAINESRGSEAYESRNHDADSETDTNTAANSAGMTSISKQPSIRSGPALSALHRASSSHVVDEAPKAMALFRSQKTVVCSVM